MGHATAAGFAEAVEDGSIDLTAALHYHLRVNHFPPHPAFMVPIAQAAVEAMNADDPYDRIPMPDGVLFRGATHAEAYLIADALHLDAFIDNEEN